jgi:hypothetical protein
MASIRVPVGVALAVFAATGFFLPAMARGVAREARPLLRIDTASSTWSLTRSVFSRQSSRSLKVPSWVGTYSGAAASAHGESGTGRSSRTVTATVYYFAAADSTQPVMIPARGEIGYKVDLTGAIGGVDQATGFRFSTDPGEPVPAGAESPGRTPFIEVRCRRGTTVFTFTGRPVGVDLIAFAREFVASNRILGEWRETEVEVAARCGDRSSLVKGAVAPDEVYRGTIRLSDSEPVTLTFTVRRLRKRADQKGIWTEEVTPVEGARIALEARGTIHRETADAAGRALLDLAKVSQSRALRFHVGLARGEPEVMGLLTLRYGREKEKLLDAGRYQPTEGPGGISADEVSRKLLAFLKAIFHDDLGRFPRSLDQDRIGALEYTPRPHFLHVLLWRLAREQRDVDAARSGRSCLPLDRLKRLSGEAEDVPDDATVASLFDSLEAPLALAMETGETGWLKAASRKLRSLASPARSAPGKAWGEQGARRCLALWRMAELAGDMNVEAAAKRETDALMHAIAASPEPSEPAPGGNGERGRDPIESGAAASHAWAVLALYKGFQSCGDAGYKAAAESQAERLLKTHVDRGHVGYSHLADGERAGECRAGHAGEGAYPEVAATVHALILAFSHTRNRDFNDAALRIRSNVRGFWRSEYGGFGKLEYVDGAGATVKGQKLNVRPPIASKRQASAYQQPWALVTFLPSMYPYWGEASPKDEDRPSRGILDFLFNRNGDADSRLGDPE